MLDVATFQANYPEFIETSPVQIGLAIARAKRWVAPWVWRTQTDDGVALLTAHFLNLSVMGQSTKLVPQGGSSFSSTTYGRAFEELRSAVVGGFAGTRGCR